MPKRDDKLLLADISEAGEKILRFTAGYTYQEYLDDERTKDAVIRNFQVIGEASRHLSQQLMDRHATIPWQKLIAFRNILVHQYFGIDHEIVWGIIDSYFFDTIRKIKGLSVGDSV
jgi:uncharacterized protein with HEPN domain